ncbi:MAG: DUF998 domain-containing protein [Promethearchaeota archaeon]|nr:MAG: DUF998 domain-containing protein [Candidatus Lokiarchaeota archaeon]
MAFFYRLKNSFSLVLKEIIDRKKIRLITLTAITIYWTTFFSSIIIIGLFRNNGYSPFNNLISDLGSIEYSPFPFLFDIGCIIAGFLSFPISVYIFSYIRENSKGVKNNKTILNFLTYILLFSGILGDIGFVGIGFFSIDRNPLNIHFIFASFLFVGYFLSAFLVGILVLLFKIRLNKNIGILGLFVSISIFFIYILLILLKINFIFFEWIADFSLLMWLYTFLYSILRNNNEERNNLKQI